MCFLWRQQGRRRLRLRLPNRLPLPLPPMPLPWLPPRLQRLPWLPWRRRFGGPVVSCVGVGGGRRVDIDAELGQGETAHTHIVEVHLG